MKTAGWAQKCIIYSYVGPMAQAEDKDLPEYEMSSSKEITLMNKWWDLVLKALESLPRTKTFSTKLD